ncbi:MAG: hypothetical protein K1V80_09755 [Muribaculaceae bacterium]
MKYTSISLFSFIAAILLLLSACSGNGNTPTPPKEAIDEVKAELAMAKKQVPVPAGYGLVITDVDFDDDTNTIKYKYKYTMPEVQKPSEEKIKLAKESAAGFLNTQPREKKLLEQGFTFHYEYYSVDDEYLYTLEFTAEDLKK